MKLVGERRALAAIVFAFFFILFFLNGLQIGAPDGNFLFALAGCYGLAFFALVAGYFWARWFAVGVGLFGVIVAAVSLWQVRHAPRRHRDAVGRCDGSALRRTDQVAREAPHGR
jgi:hypothetical protein